MYHLNFYKRLDLFLTRHPLGYVQKSVSIICHFNHENSNYIVYRIAFNVWLLWNKTLFLVITLFQIRTVILLSGSYDWIKLRATWYYLCFNQNICYWKTIFYGSICTWNKIMRQPRPLKHVFRIRLVLYVYFLEYSLHKVWSRLSGNLAKHLT